ncbi:hypothetical protein CCAX7_65660 [Capsulimonas corticalis]|uniref:Uncharacterized protein n=1 Tax=Capsulimonas corticalis TaxID=2219043 RepID=A0A402CR58_9BACT|nr:BlaI/MecI/CopY family transcriptional regulator [Capsulimonas corticalis]BDI34515.1 hypothetical protein CCAX7_65660 [Capsulimonas corticalis]
MPRKQEEYLTKREQQIMEIIYRHGRADVAAVMDGLADDLSNSAVRTHLRILESKGHLTHAEENGRFIYAPTRARKSAARSALSGLLQTFFDDSVEQVMATMLSVRGKNLKPEELDRLSEMIERARAAKTPDAAPESETQSDRED